MENEFEKLLKIYIFEAKETKDSQSESIYLMIKR